MKTLVKSVAVVMLAVVLLVSALPLEVFADASFPSLSASHYCEMIACTRINVYNDYSLTTRGTTSPSKTYNAYIDAGDKIQILEATPSYLIVTYPTSSGARTGIIRTSDLFGCSAPSEYISSSQASVTTYTYDSTSNRSGSIDAGDEVYRLSSTGNGFVLVIYTARSGSRAYKAAFVTRSDFDRMKGGNSSNSSGGSSQSDVTERMKAIAYGNLTLDGNTDLALGHTFVGTRSGEQCKGYAKNVFYLCFGITVGSTESNNYKLSFVNGVSLVGTVTDMSEQNIKALFANARPGDFVQMRRNHGGPHSMIVYAVLADGIKVFEANTDGQNTISGSSYTWADLCERNVAMSVYTATNYALK